MPELKLSLLHNSHSFLKEALERALEAENDIQQWKFAILSLVQAIELSVKEKLRREHWVLIYRNVDSQDHTVSLEQSIKRLEQICKIDVSSKDIDAIKIASRWRNAIVHFEIEFNIETVKSIFVKLFSFLDYFHRKHLQENLMNILDTALWDEAMSIKEYAREIYERAQVRFQEDKIEAEFVWNCPNCDMPSFVIQDDINTCYVCGYEDDVIQCESCQEFFLISDTEAVEQYDYEGSEIRNLCFKCKEDYLEELDYSSYYGDDYPDYPEYSEDPD
ncbi:MAG TPA: hypothetical protein PKE39_16680 [Ignavibacteria bacterium]|nr:hypothetical protein [Ignavibacteria bacterium]